MLSIVKNFPNVLANDHINFFINQGEIHALLGENGAGKTTLMNILFGLYQADEGEIRVRGKSVSIKSPKDAIQLGIGMVHQHFKLVDTNTVAENIALSLQFEGPKASFLNILQFFQNPLPAVEKRIIGLSKRYCLSLDPLTKIWQLSLGEQQRVEILKILIKGVEILILDEPTSVLTPIETEDLFKTLEAMRNEGRSIIFITHKLDEVMKISDRVTVLQNGRVITTLETSKTSKRELARLMIGREVLFRLHKEKVDMGPPILKVQGLEALNDKFLPALKGISFTVHSGEIVGIAGVAGNGQKELVETITGLRKTSKGEITILGKDVTNSSSRIIAQQDVAHIPEERIKVGIVPNMKVSENIILRGYENRPFSKGPLLNTSLIANYSQKLITEYNIITPSLNEPVKLLSGGNIQRLILARELSRDPKLIIAAHPTYGLDVGATEQIRQLLLSQRKKGVAILLVSEDLEEILSLSDRIVVMFEGKIMGEMATEAADNEEIGLMMAGVKA